MFQPMPTPAASYEYGVIANANIPDYVFAPTLGDSGGSSGRAFERLGPEAAHISGPQPIPIHRGFPPTNTNINTNERHYQSHQQASDGRKRNLSSGLNARFRRASYGSPSNSIARQHHHVPRHVKMERSIKTEQTSDLAAQEAAARDFNPDPEGPMVGEKTSSHAITEEYAKADPTFVAKTMSLPQTYSHFRPVQGDGNCGWRAIFFGYFECLIQTRDVAQVKAELSRLTSLNDYLVTIGHYETFMFEDMYEETKILMDEIIKAMTSSQDALPILMRKFNDEETSQPLIYHLRLLAASWLKGNLTEFEPYIVGDVNSYCDEWILPVNREIDHLGLMLLIGVLLKPANMVLEVAYLDRSEGDNVNVHRMPDDANVQDPSVLARTIHLLYRPGHYDLLYRIAQPLPPAPSGPISLQINRASFSHQPEIRSAGPSFGTYPATDLSLLGLIPTYEQPGLPVASPPSSASPLGDNYSPSPQSSWATHTYPESISSQPQSQPSPAAQQSYSPTSPEVSLRFSKYNFPQLPGVVDASTYAVEPSFSTTTFKNSHYNTAHYNNPHFQPEEYRPENDEDGTPPKSCGRKRST